jgi:hypothetical protein
LIEKDVEGMTIEKTVDQKGAAVGLAETVEKMKVLSGLLRRNERSSCSVECFATDEKRGTWKLQTTNYEILSE